MSIALELPDELLRRLEKRKGDPARWALEAVAAEAYREGVLTSAEVGRTLGHTSRAQTEAFLKQARAPLGYTVEDLQRDADTLRDLLGT